MSAMQASFVRAVNRSPVVPFEGGLWKKGEVGGGYSPQSKALFAAMTVQPSSQRERLYDALIRKLVIAGIWVKLDALYIMAAHDAQAARLNLVNPTGPYNATAVNAPTFTTDRSYNGNGTTSYLNTNFNPSTAGGKYTQDSAHFGAYMLTAAGSGNSPAGSFDGSKGLTFNPRTTSDAIQCRINSTTAAAGPANITDGRGFTLVNRLDSANAQYYKNGTLNLTDPRVSASLANVPICLGAVSPSLITSNSQFAASTIGARLTSTEVAAYNEAVASYMTAVGAA